MSDDFVIKTNNQPRPVINGWELTPEERAEFDYIDWVAVEDGRTSAEFFRYKGHVYDLHDYEPVGGSPMPASLKGWDGFYSDSFFSGVVFRFPRNHYGRDVEIDTDFVIVGTYYS